MELLCESDSSLYSSLIAGRYVFWYEPTVPGPLLLLRHCAINKEYCAWKEHGIIASMLYSYFANRAYSEGRFRGLDRARLEMVNRDIFSNVRIWLEEQSFPKELIDCFRK